LPKQKLIRSENSNYKRADRKCGERSKYSHFEGISLFLQKIRAFESSQKFFDEITLSMDSLIVR
jgi:hypothetical protein